VEQVTKDHLVEQEIHLPQVPLKVLLEEDVQVLIKEIMEALEEVELQKQVK
tara:strand:- start:155 stop:307 length:153 start_codon:yes stop_codon:yes gene_type:complete